MRIALYHCEEKLVDTRIVVQFRVEGSYELATLSGSDDMSVNLSQDLAIGRQHLFYIWRAYEGHGDIIADTFHRCNRMEASQLAAIGITLHTDIHRAEVHGR